jgi:hypothetical protein
MIVVNALRSLASQKRKDAKVLYNANRYSSAIYLMGYAIELKLKSKICSTLGFKMGFPESKSELTTYLGPLTTSGSLSTGILPTQIKDIKNHDLNKLILFSGVEIRIRTHYYNEWLNVQAWNPEDRYKIRRYSKAKCDRFMKSAIKILKEIS